MFKSINIIVIAIFFILILFSFGFCEETMTITTYYPSPYGSYNELRTNQMSIGSAYASQTLSNGSLIVEGNVGIGTESPSTKLDVRVSVNGNWAGIIANELGTSGPKGLLVLTGQNASNTAFAVANGSVASPTTVFYVRGDGVVAGVFGTYHQSSDMRKKTDIVTIDKALDKVMQLRGVYFRWKDASENFPGDTEQRMGFIAQEVEPVVPQAVSTAQDAMRTKAVSDGNALPALLVEAIKEQQKEIGELQKKIRALEVKLLGTFPEVTP